MESGVEGYHMIDATVLLARIHIVFQALLYDDPQAIHNDVHLIAMPL